MQKDTENSYLPDPLRLCVELLITAAWCSQTQGMTGQEIKAAASVLFERSIIEEATEILCGRSKKKYKDGKLQEVRNDFDV